MDKLRQLSLIAIITVIGAKSPNLDLNILKKSIIEEAKSCYEFQVDPSQFNYSDYIAKIKGNESIQKEFDIKNLSQLEQKFLEKNILFTRSRSPQLRSYETTTVQDPITYFLGKIEREDRLIINTKKGEIYFYLISNPDELNFVKHPSFDKDKYHKEIQIYFCNPIIKSFFSHADMINPAMCVDSTFIYFDLEDLRGRNFSNVLKREVIRTVYKDFKMSSQDTEALVQKIEF
ncbi:MAG: hypothetical protein PHG05_01870 [Candidatus Nanoarchaeia archaeon]|nr:hypothetical protein [Candidatus Nanoarchaeia archaeon]